MASPSSLLYLTTCLRINIMDTRHTSSSILHKLLDILHKLLDILHKLQDILHKLQDIRPSHMATPHTPNLKHTLQSPKEMPNHMDILHILNLLPLDINIHLQPLGILRNPILQLLGILHILTCSPWVSSATPSFSS